jgi:hypothetical protein
MKVHGMDPERIARVVAALAVGEADPQQSLCAAAAELVGVDGAGLVLVSGGRTLGNVCVSDPRAEAVDEVQYLLGEGPCMDAVRTRAPALAPDLAAPDLVRWPGFCTGAAAAGVRAAFGFPLLVGPACIGALDLFQVEPGKLTDEQFENAVAVAYVAGRTVVSWQLGARHGSVAWQLEQVPSHRAVVHQATGRVSVQASVSVDDALTLLRAYAFAEDRPISDVASDVADGHLRFD